MWCGIDSSTQSLKVMLVDSSHLIHHEVSVNFDAELASVYPIQGGITRSTYGLPKEVEAEAIQRSGPSSSLIVTSPSLLFVHALDLAFDRLKAQGAPLQSVVGVSGSGQQHGSVYWRRGSEQRLQSLSPDQPLHAQLADAFVIPNGPIWMDSSTSLQCQQLTAAVGGAQQLAALTGSRAYERFTGNQIAKVAALFPSQYSDCERISLVSSFLACLLLGRFAPIDASDAAGMNLMNLRTQQWDDTLLMAVDPSGHLKAKLGDSIAASNAVLGPVSPYFVQRWGFSDRCQVVACTGDNPSTLAGLELTEPGDVGVSLGTSDTLFAVVSDAQPSALEGHVFINPVDTNTAMLMAVFKNGSLTRQAVRDRVCQGSWETFNAALQRSPAGNGGQVQFTYLEAEITPTVHKTGIFRFNADDQKVDGFASMEAEVRGLIEGQFLSLKSHAHHLGLSRPKRIVASGGASVNPALLQVLADVFQAPVQVQVVTDTRTGKDASAINNTAALGAALRALWAIEGKPQSQDPPKAQNENAAKEVQDAASASHVDTVSARVSLSTAATPRKETAAVYDALLQRFEKLEKQLVAQLQ